MSEPYVETAPAQGMTNLPFLVGREDHKGNGFGTDGPKLWNAQLPIAEDFDRNIRPVLEKQGFGWVDFHVMRRTHSSLMRELGVDPKVVADQQGHTLDVNLNVYTETSVKSRIEAVETLESAFVN